MRKAEPKKVRLDVQYAIADVLTVVESELRRQRVSVEFEPTQRCPP
jgi:hypothetical protein